MHETDRDHDDVAAGQQRVGRRVPQPLDLLVDRGVLLDVGVGLRDVGLGLVVVVVADEVLDGVVRQQLAELVGELGGQGLVRRHHQGRSLQPLDQPRRGRGLAGAGRAQQHDVRARRRGSAARARRWRPAGRRRADSRRSPRTAPRVSSSSLTGRVMPHRTLTADIPRRCGPGPLGSRRSAGGRPGRPRAPSTMATRSSRSPELSITKSATSRRSSVLAWAAIRLRASASAIPRSRPVAPAARPPGPPRPRPRRSRPRAGSPRAAGRRRPRRSPQVASAMSSPVRSATSGWMIALSAASRSGRRTRRAPARPVEPSVGGQHGGPELRDHLVEPGVPGSTTSRASWSASTTTAPLAANSRATADLPAPMPPVSPNLQHQPPPSRPR